MSVAGKRSSQGDEYQVLVAMHWVIRLLSDNSIKYIQVDSTGAPGVEGRITVDDVVICFKDGHFEFVQAKKNQPKYSEWKFSDKTMVSELKKAAEQLSGQGNNRVLFYSRSAFGEVQKIAEDCRLYADYKSLVQSATASITRPLEQLALVIDTSVEDAYSVARSLFFGPQYGFEEWERQNLFELGRVLPQSDTAYDILYKLICHHQANFPGASHVLCREDLLKALAAKNLAPTPMRSEKEIQSAFRSASAIGRSNVIRKIGGTKIPRKETEEILKHVQNGAQTVLLTSGPGSGKTCVLLDLAERIEADNTLELLFIKGDLFAEATTEDELTAQQLPRDIVGQCARLSKFRRVVVLLDSLDVLSLNRNQGALSVFLRIFDRLETCDHVSCIVACRTFDLTYDATLQGRSWEHRIEIAPLDFDTEVSPLLKQWGINPDALGNELCELLRVPRNLFLFEKLASKEDLGGIISAFDLHERYIEEAIAKNKSLGASAMTFLSSMANECIQRRTLYTPTSAVQVDAILLQALLSEDILVEPRLGTIGFAHQTLAECFAVREAIGHGKTLLDFILSHPPLPFIRPAVRVFFQHLRAYDPDGFRRQTRAVIEDVMVSYHLKRLVCESMGEMIPQPEDFPLIRRLFSIDQELFSRFLWHAKHINWLQILSEQWLPIASTVENKNEWLTRFAKHIKIWSNDRPNEVIALWKQLLDRSEDSHNIIYFIFSGLDKFTQWHTAGAKELLEELLNTGKLDRDYWGKTISKFVESTDSGDDILWNFITEKITAESVEKYDFDGTLRCGLHDFHSETFLSDRLKKSNTLLSRAIEKLDEWSRSGYHAVESYPSRFVDRSSYGEKYSEYFTPHDGDIENLLKAVEEALIHRSKINDQWWKQHEPSLRITTSCVLRYFTIIAYQENIVQNIEGIEHQLQDKKLLEHGHIGKAIQIMIATVYPYISPDSQIKHQETINLCFQGEEYEEKIAEYKRTTYRIRIPCIYRTETTQAAIEQVRDFVYYPTTFRRRGGWVRSPISLEMLCGLSEESIVRLLKHYDSHEQKYNHDEDGNISGGLSSVAQTLGNACEIDPLRFIPLIQTIQGNNLDKVYTEKIISGLSNHIRYREGGLTPPNEWEPIAPLPPAQNLAKKLLDILSARFSTNLDTQTFCRAIKACCHVLTDEDSNKRLAAILFNASKMDSSSTILGTDNLLSHALNSPLGIMAESTIILVNNILDNDVEIVSELKETLLAFSRLNVPYAHAVLLRRLPFTIYKNPEFGWHLFDVITEIIQNNALSHTKLCLYHNYQKSFERVSPILEKIFNDALDDAGNTWGSISALAYLCGNIEKETFFAKLISSNEQAMASATEIFAHNIGVESIANLCHDGLLACLGTLPLSSEILSNAATAFEDERLAVSAKTFAIEYLRGIAQVDGSCRLFRFAKWLPRHARHDPISALDVLEELANVIEARADNSSLHVRAEELSAAFMEVLREADETNDDELIRRVISLQDKFLRLNVGKIHELYEQ